MLFFVNNHVMCCLFPYIRKICTINLLTQPPNLQIQWERTTHPSETFRMISVSINNVVFFLQTGFVNNNVMYCLFLCLVLRPAELFAYMLMLPLLVFRLLLSWSFSRLRSSLCFTAGCVKDLGFFLTHPKDPINSLLK